MISRAPRAGRFAFSPVALALAGLTAAFAFGACSRGAASSPPPSDASSTAGAPPAKAASAVDPRLGQALAALDKAAAEMGAVEAAAVRSRIEASPEDFLNGLDTVLAERVLDPDRFARVDKVAPPLGSDFVPKDLVSLDGILPTARAGLSLRSAAADALSAMVRAAKADGVALVAGSSYRSWNYQKTVFDREVRTYGEETARSESAEPGRSQHQLGTALDFSPIDDSFAKSGAFAWLSGHAREFGFSRSYPDGMEKVTGYRPESWHWRWIGAAAAALEGKYFDGVQQYLIEFLSDY